MIETFFKTSSKDYRRIISEEIDLSMSGYLIRIIVYILRIIGGKRVEVKLKIVV